MQNMKPMDKMTQFVIQCQLAGSEIPLSVGWSRWMPVLPTTADHCSYIPVQYEKNIYVWEKDIMHYATAWCSQLM